MGKIEETIEAVGIISGGVMVDAGDVRKITACQHHFEFYLITKVLKLNENWCWRWQEKDRVHILN